MCSSGKQCAHIQSVKDKFAQFVLASSDVRICRNNDSFLCDGSERANRCDAARAEPRKPAALSKKVDALLLLGAAPGDGEHLMAGEEHHYPGPGVVELPGHKVLSGAL